jgi:hypothetical protein
VARDERDAPLTDRPDHRRGRRLAVRCGDLDRLGALEERVEARAAEHADLGAGGHDPSFDADVDDDVDAASVFVDEPPSPDEDEDEDEDEPESERDPDPEPSSFLLGVEPEDFRLSVA